MADIITFAVAGIFAIVTALVVMTFLLIRQQNGKPRFETHDYYKSYRRSDGYFSGGNPFKQGTVLQDRKEQRTIAMAVVALAVIAVLVAFFVDVFEGLLVIFLLPIVIRFIRMHDEANSNRNRTKDESRSSY